MSTHLVPTEERTRRRSDSTDAGFATGPLVVDGLVSGLAGGIALAIPLVVWDWGHIAHRALELPMAATAWLFGLQHFSHAENLWWSIVLGSVLLVLYAAASGVAFAVLADRVFALESPLSSLVGGVVWGFVSFLFFWFMLLPIARDGVPFRVSPRAPTMFVAVNWVWILGFTLFGLVTGGVYAAMRGSRARRVGRSRPGSRRPEAEASLCGAEDREERHGRPGFRVPCRPCETRRAAP